MKKPKNMPATEKLLFHSLIGQSPDHIFQGITPFPDTVGQWPESVLCLFVAVALLIKPRWIFHRGFFISQPGHDVQNVADGRRGL